MKKYFLLIFLFNYCVYSQEIIHEIDTELENCLNDENNFTTLGMQSCYSEAELKWDKELNSVYSKLIYNLDNNSKIKLRESQRNWIIFRDKEIEYLKQFYYSKKGTIWKVNFSMYKMDIVKSRAISLSNYYNSTLD
jgi:uncharacterized protein YecT (DUF1311 family)